MITIANAFYLMAMIVVVIAALLLVTVWIKDR